MRELTRQSLEAWKGEQGSRRGCQWMERDAHYRGIIAGSLWFRANSGGRRTLGMKSRLESLTNPKYTGAIP